VLGVHRKLVPTRTERFVHANGDGSTLNVYPTKYGELGGLLCGENTNSLARFALLAQGQKIHTAHWPSFPTKHSRDGLDGIDIRIRYHAYEGKIFVISSSAVFGQDSLKRLCVTEASRALATLGGSVSGVINPYGKYIGGPLQDEEGIVYAEVDLEQMIDAKTLHDVVGNYNRFDVLSLVYRRTSPKPVLFPGEDAASESVSDMASSLRCLIQRLESKEELRTAASSEIAELREMLAKIPSRKTAD
jgi:aliphatic nitrilase